jgi:tetratricopeptide (TPR) repeat protein
LLCRYWGIFWIDASTDESIQQSFTQVARLLQVDENIESVRRSLANTSQPWLLVFDNADDPNFSLYPHLPTGNRGDIIITSRNPEFQQYNTVGYKEVGRLSLEDSVLLLHKIVYGATGLSKQDTEESKRVVQTLGCLALAIVQAGAYIRKTSCSFHIYLEIYEKRQRHLLQYLPMHLGTGYQYSVYTTWQVSVDMIESRHDTASHHALRLLSLLGFFHHDQIPVQMFYNAWHQLQTTQTPEFLPWHDEISDFFGYRQSVEASITLLISFSLITRNADASLSLHPLVHDWSRDRMSQDEQQLSYRRALWLLIGSVEWKFEIEDFAFRRTLVPHVHEFLRLRSYQDELDDEDKIQNWPTLALILEENGWTSDALLLTEEVLQLRKRMLGESHPDTLTSIHSLAICYNLAGRRSEALQLAEQVLHLRKMVLGESHPDSLTSMHSLAICYNLAGRRSEALQLAEQVVNLRKMVLGESHPDSLTSMHSLAICYNPAGRRSEALQLAEQVLHMRKRVLGESHPDTLTSMHSLAICYSQAGRRSEALQLAEQVLHLRKRMLGEGHPDSLTSMHSLAVCYRQAGQQTEALQLMEEVLQLRKRMLGEGHPDSLTSMHSLAIWYYNVGRRSEALMLIGVLKLHGTKLDEDFPDNLNEGSFVDSAYGTASHGQFNRIELVSTEVIIPAPRDIDDAGTEYSDISTAESKIYTYMECLANDLFSIASSLQSDPQHSRNLCKALPDLLQEFALRIGQETPSKEGREVMAYVHKHRR